MPFTHHFVQPGVHAVQVAVEGVTPGDYDPTNNIKDGTIAVAGNGFTYMYASFQESIRTWEYGNRWDQLWNPAESRRIVGHSWNRDVMARQALFVNAFKEIEVAWPVHVDASIAGDGVVLHQVSHDFAEPDAFHDGPGFTQQCSSRWEPNADGTVFDLHVCTYRSGDYANTSTSFGTYTGSVTYFGQTFWTDYWNDAVQYEGSYAYNSNSSWVAPRWTSPQRRSRSRSPCSRPRTRRKAASR